MTGPEHYRKAEEALAKLPESVAGGHYERALLDEAQVHATLAVAAATAATTRRTSTATTEIDVAIRDDWAAVLW